MLEYEVGSIPSRPLTLLVKDDSDNPVSLLGYDGWTLEIKGTNDDDVDISGVNLFVLPNVEGALSVVWPRTRSIFDKKGTYLLRLSLTTQDGGRDITRAAEIKVREFGRIN